MEPLRFSMIVATIGRTKELNRFMESVVEQKYNHAEVIIVDQNKDNRLDEIVRSFRDKLQILHLKSEPGLSRARNVGLKQATGDIISFPDDDCWYEPQLLHSVLHLFEAEPEKDGITGIVVDQDGVPAVSRWASKPGFFSWKDVWTRGVSVTVFIKKKVIEKTGLFDETLGAGSGTRWGSGEESDLLIRAIKNNFRIWYHPELKVGHPKPVIIYNQKSFDRAKLYGQGFGKVLRKHKFPFLHVMYHLFRPLGGSALSLLQLNGHKARYHFYGFWGRLKGWAC